MQVEEALAYLNGARQAGRLAQGYVIEGPLRGEATQLARGLLSLLFCGEDDVPCGACRACRQVSERTHPDILWLEPQKKSRQISVDQIRDLQSRIYQTSFGGGWKAGVIVGADRMNPSAANAFLKVLEEPPGESMFLLLTEAPQFLLPTIFSRCQRLAVGADAVQLPEAWRDQLVELLVGCGDGYIEGSRIVAVERNSARLQALLKEVMQVATDHEKETADEESVDESRDTLDARIGARYRELRASILRALMGWYRDIFLLLCGGDPSLVYFADQLDVLTARANALSYREALANVATVEAMNRKLEQNLPEPLVLTDAFHQLR
ncbi:MAG: hypothetical protein HQ523_12150 [Lentisphaerae bacterium]|nr:hypothetical protein [Lentisphaerota bacterium]